jgi:hypothetical protein
MSDVNTFIDAIGKDVNAAVVPQVEDLAKRIEAATLSNYVPKISAFAEQLVKQIIDEQSVIVRDFATRLVQDLFNRYRPEVKGDLHTRIVQGGLHVTGQGIRLDVVRQDTGAVVSSLDIPVDITIKVDDVSATLQNTTVRLDVV